MKDYTYFSPSVTEFIEEGNIYVAPEFIDRSKSNYRYDHMRKILQKKCIQCKEYFDVQEFNNGQFYDVHDEEKIHYISDASGYATRCKKCEFEFNKIKEESEELKMFVKENEIASLNLSDENRMFIRVIAALKNVSQEEFANELLDSVRKYNKFKIEYEELI